MKSITLLWISVFTLAFSSSNYAQPVKVEIARQPIEVEMNYAQPVKVEIARQPIEVEMKTDFPQNPDARFRLFKTMNLYNHILLDTRTGRITGVQCSFGEKAEGATGWVTISDKCLVANEKESKDGRFTLYKTMNLYNYIILDQENGRMWLFQYVIGDSQKTGISPIQELTGAKKPGTE